MTGGRWAVEIVAAGMRAPFVGMRRRHAAMPMRPARPRVDPPEEVGHPLPGARRAGEVDLEGVLHRLSDEPG